MDASTKLDTSYEEHMTDTSPIIIKKYANRRLYNTQSSSYIVATDVIALIEQNVPFQIVDAKSGEDLTRNILNQIIFEQESQKQGFLLPLEFQKQLILMYSDAYKAVLPSYLSQAMQTFFDQRDSMAQSFHKTVQQNNAAWVSFTQKMAEQNRAYLQHSLNMFRTFTGTDSADEQELNPENSVAGQTQTSKDRREDLQAIKDQLSQLQQQLNDLESEHEPR